MTKLTKHFAAALLVIGASACVTTGKYQTKEKEAADNAARADEAAAKVSELEKQAQGLQHDLDQAQQELASVKSERDDLQAKAATLAEEKVAVQAESEQYKSLSSSLQKEIEAGQIEITDLRNKMLVKLKDKILFPSGSAKLSKQGKETLDVIAATFKDLKDRTVIVGGYTDDVPVAGNLPYKDNWDLSSARAIAVVRYLASKGVPPEMLSAAGFSEYHPVVPNDSAENRGQNRRIEIALTANE
jgi:chemotaxis protein MotB